MKTTICRTAQEFERKLGKRMRAIRLNRKLSITEVCQRMVSQDNGVSVSVAGYRHWENNTRTPPVGLLPIIAEALSCSVADLVN